VIIAKASGAIVVDEGMSRNWIVAQESSQFRKVLLCRLVH